LDVSDASQQQRGEQVTIAQTFFDSRGNFFEQPFVLFSREAEIRITEHRSV